MGIFLNKLIFSKSFPGQIHFPGFWPFLRITTIIALIAIDIVLTVIVWFLHDIASN